MNAALHAKEMHIANHIMLNFKVGGAGTLAKFCVAKVILTPTSLGEEKLWRKLSMGKEECRTLIYCG